MTDRATPTKAAFDGIYNQPDARAYYTTLADLEYTVPGYGADVFRRLLGARPPGGAVPPTVLDVCCSYGVGAALLTTDLTLDDLYAHYRQAAAQGMDGDRLVAADRGLLHEHRVADPPRVLGLDVADRAVDYALAIGVIDDAAVENLEVAAPSTRLVGLLADVDLVVTTGGIGYVTERTIGRLVEHTAAAPWVAAFCLRTYDYRPIARCLADRGLRTERAGRVFPQRRFVDDTERNWAIAQVVARGIDPTGAEATGRYFAEFFLSRPVNQVSEQPLAALLPDLA